MQRVTIQSYGIIPIHRSSNGDQVLLVEQYSAQGTHWGFPKGKTMPGERPIDTAVREAREEVGLVFRKIHENDTFSEQYSFTYEDVIVDKTVVYYIGFVHNPGIAMREQEIKDAGWYSFEKARRKITFLNTQKILDAAADYLDQQDKDTI